MPRGYQWEVQVGGCMATVLEAAFWFMMLWALFGGCRTCLFLTFALLVAGSAGWVQAGWLGALSAWGMVLWLWQQLRWWLPPTPTPALGGDRR
jgi:hypothetical protein